ncbi:S41 family peptidase [bacterium]|nr:MAG: S41 family peptidase [bacterium]
MRKKIFISILLVVFILVSASVGIAAIQMQQKKKNELYKQIEIFSDALAVIQSDYVDELNNKDLIYGALKGMLASLDPYSDFMDPQKYKELKVETEGKFGGLGIEITLKDGLLTVVTPYEDTPAWKAGVKPNDRIVKINNEFTRDITLDDAVKKLRGNPGEAVAITIYREQEKKTLDLNIVRDIIKIKDIKKAVILEDGIGYIQLLEFRENTADDFDIALEKLKKEGMDCLILDLRNNPGGILDVAVSVVEKFIEKNKLVLSTKGRKPEQSSQYLSHSKNPILDIPIVVLINDGSASGSEIVAGALQDYKRAIILGTKSFGKGSVQSVIPLPDGSALKLTTSKYFTPLGRQIHGIGVVPDIAVEEPAVDSVKKDKESEKIFKEVEKNDSAPEKKDNTVEGKFDYKNDLQIVRAMDVLKAVKIYKK